MRTFVMAVVLAIEERYNFVRLGESDLYSQVIIAIMVVAGFLMAVFQDKKELERR